MRANFSPQFCSSVKPKPKLTVRGGEQPVVDWRRRRVRVAVVSSSANASRARRGRGPVCRGVAAAAAVEPLQLDAVDAAPAAVHAARSGHDGGCDRERRNEGDCKVIPVAERGVATHSKSMSRELPLRFSRFATFGGGRKQSEQQTGREGESERTNNGCKAVKLQTHICKFQTHIWKVGIALWP